MQNAFFIYDVQGNSKVESIAVWWMWVIFFALVLVMLAVDTFLLGGKKAHRISSKEALSWTVVWIVIALSFNALLAWYLAETHSIVLAQQKSLEFLTGYLIEKSLSVDNLFIFLMLFNYFAVPAEYQRRVLLFGVLGAIVLRLIMILIGTWLITKFAWILYIFGAFLIISGFKMFFMADKKPDISKNVIVVWMRKYLRITDTFHQEKFLIKRNKVIYLTPLCIVLVLIEITDLVFAVDSIPAIFAITTDPFIVVTSNIFAILGLRALYFLLADLADRFHLLKYGLAIILVFVGTKMLIMHWIKIPIVVSLSVVIGILFGAVLLSYWRNRHPNPKM